MGSLFGKGGGSSNTTITQDNEPPTWARGLFSKSAGDAMDLYNSGAGFNIWPGSTVAEPSEMTRLGSQGLINVALSPDSNALAQNPVNLTNQVVGQGGLMAPAQNAMDFFGDVAGGGQSPSTDPFYDAMNAAYNPATLQATNIYGQAGSGQFNTDVGRHYQPMARGDFLESGNPHFRKLLDKEADNLGDRIGGMFSGAGRYGSGAHQDVVGDTVGDFMLKGLGQDFDRERGYQMQAIRGLQDIDAQNAATQLHGAQGLGGMGQNLFQNLLGGAQSTFGAERANLSDRFGAAQAGANLSNQGLQNALGFMGALPTVQQNRTFAPQLLQQAGAQQDQFNQAQINDMVRRFYEQDMQPWTRLGALQAAAQGAAGGYGKMHQVTSAPSQQMNPLGLLGGAMQLAMPFF